MKRTVTILLGMILCVLLAGLISAQNVEYVSSIFWSSVVDVKVVGDYAYCAFANGLVILDVSDPSIPVFISELYCQGSREGIDVNGNYAYLADREYGIQIIDISQPTAPVFAGSYDTPGLALDVFVSGGYAYVADYDSLQIIDITDPSAPAFTGSFNTGGNHATGVFVSGNYAYMALRYGLLIVEVSDPSNPIQAGFCSMPGYGEDVFVSGNYAYVADGGLGLQIADISNPLNPILIGAYDTPGRAWGVFVLGGYAFVADSYTLLVINVSDPTNPTFAGSYDTPGEIHNVFLSGNYAFMGNTYSGLQIIDVTDPNNPTLAGSYNPWRLTTDIFVSGNFGYAIEGGDIQIIDLSNPAYPVIVGSYVTPGIAYDIFVSNGYAYVADFDSLQIINVSDPLNPTFAGSLGAEHNSGIFVCGDYAYLVSDSLRIINVSNPSNPTFAGCYDTTGSIYDVFVLNNYAFLAAGYGGLLIIDVSDPSSPYFVGNYATGSVGVGYVYIYGDYAYLSAYTELWASGLIIVDIVDPSNPTRAGGQILDPGVYNIMVSGNYAYVSNGSTGLGIFDISILPYPPLIASYDTPGDAVDVVVDDENVYVADRNSLMVLRFDPETGVIKPINQPNRFILYQNYPNPFNAATTIRYELPEPAAVKIDIYDLLGRKVKTLLDEHREAGIHGMGFDASDLSSGVYFYKLQAGEYTESKKMNLLK